MSTAHELAEVLGLMFVAFATVCLLLLLQERSYDTMTAAGLAVTIPATSWVFGYLAALPSKENR